MHLQLPIEWPRFQLYIRMGRKAEEHTKSNIVCHISENSNDYFQKIGRVTQIYANKLTNTEQKQKPKKTRLTYLLGGEFQELKLKKKKSIFCKVSTHRCLYYIFKL